MSGTGTSEGALTSWYRRRVGEPTTGDEVRGYWMFVAGLALAVVGVVLFLYSTTLQRGTGTFFGVREAGYVLAALGLPLALLGFVERLPLRRWANYAAYLGVVVCVLAIAWFVVAFPQGWATGGGGQAAGVITLYTAGLVVLGLGGVLVPLLTGPAPAAEARAAAAEQRAVDAEARAGIARDRAATAGARADAEADRAADAEARAASLAAELEAVADSAARFEVYEDRGGKWRWRLRHRNGRVLADSGQGYASRRNAQRGLHSVQRNAYGAPILQVEPDVAEQEEVTDAEALAPLGDYESRAAFEGYEDEAGEHRWRLVHRNGNVLADSGQGYSSRAAARRGIESVRANAAEADYLHPDPTAFEVYRDAEGRWRWRLIHRNGRILADSGQGYASRSGAREAVEHVAERAPDADFEVYEDRAGEHRWRLERPNGEIVADSGEGYASRGGAEEAVERVQEHAPDADTLEIGIAAVEIYEDRAGEWRWRLRHRNGNVLADSGQGYGSRSDARGAVDGVKRNAPGAAEAGAEETAA